MATTSPARIDDDLYASAKLAGKVQSRSASQQVAHWARIGREIEASASISPKEIAEVLAGSRSYDALSAKEQAVVRAEWSERIDELRDSLNFATQFAAAGRTWVELDDSGKVVERGKAKAQPLPKAKRVVKAKPVVKAKAAVIANPAAKARPVAKATQAAANARRAGARATR